MALTKENKAELIEKFGKSPSNTASSQVQIALLTKRLGYLKEHFDLNKKDKHSRTGLLKIVGKRKRLLSYLQKKDSSAYKTLIGQLGLRK